MKRRDLPARRFGPETMADLAPSAAPHREPLPPPPRVLLALTRAYLGVCAVGCGAAALLMAVLLGLQEPAGHAVLVFGLIAALAAAATQLPVASAGWTLTAVQSAVVLALAQTALSFGWGLGAPMLSITGLMVCALCAAAGWRAGLVLAAVSLAAAVWVAVGAAAQSPADGLSVVGFRLGLHVIGIAVGLAGGLMISRTVSRSTVKAQDREERFRRLLALAADGYWEMDHLCRLVPATDVAGVPRPLQPSGGYGQVPWESAQFGCDPDTLDRLQADLEARQPFHDLPVRWRLEGGDIRALRVSGEPRFDRQGRFCGYWGVARDVTAELAAQEALAATETRYRDLFSRTPTPLVLHRGGRVIDANPAALALFGHADLAAMAGTDVLAAYDSGDSRERARRRLDTLQGQPLGTALPVADFQLTVRGRRLSVRATGVRVESAGGPAVLSMFIDDSERRAAEEAVRRSEAMLSHLVATSPDLITLTDLASGRFVMVNKTFERLTGWSAAEAVGRTSLELGTWARAQDREAFVAALREQGRVEDLPAEFRRRDGGTFASTVSAARLVMNGQDYIVINARDVSERERQRLEREAILANASVGIAVTRDGRFVLANRHFERLYGWGSGELPGQAAAVAWDGDAEYAELARHTDPPLARGESVELERRARRRDGSSFLARIRGCCVDPARPLEGGTVWIVEDVTERREFERTLARARDEAESANRAKSAFLANTSHELRTPLNGLLGLAELARDELVDTERRRAYLDQIVLTARSLAAIISDILDLSKIEAGKLLIDATAFDLGAELQGLQRGYGTLAQAQGLDLQLQVQADVVGTVHGDPLRLRQILGNLLSNAIKFTAEGSVVLAAQRLAGGEVVRFEVRDTGPGLDAATRARLFQPFTQADQSTTRRYGGSGLGLSICQQLAALMGGGVGVDSVPGQGSTFWVELPLPLTAVRAPLPAIPAVQTGAAGLAGARVLMVEDNAVNMLIAVALLERWGVAVVQAFDGQQALAALAAAQAAGLPFHAVLMDVQMPVMSGHEATRALRQAGHTVPVIALTAAALAGEREAALEAGMNDFLTKPIDSAKLLAALSRWCAVRT